MTLDPQFFRVANPQIPASAFQSGEVLGGSLLVYDGHTLLSERENARPLLVQSAEKERGSMPLIGT